MTNKPAKSNLERLARSKRRVGIPDLLNASSASEILDDVSRLPGLERVAVIAQSDAGDEIYYNFNPRGVIYLLEIMKTKLVNNLLYPDDEDEEEDNG